LHVRLFTPFPLSPVFQTYDSPPFSPHRCFFPQCVFARSPPFSPRVFTSGHRRYILRDCEQVLRLKKIGTIFLFFVLVFLDSPNLPSSKPRSLAEAMGEGTENRQCGVDIHPPPFSVQSLDLVPLLSLFLFPPSLMKSSFPWVGVSWGASLHWSRS